MTIQSSHVGQVRPNLQPSLAELGQQPQAGKRYFPAWQRQDPFGWNVVLVTEVTDTAVRHLRGGAHYGGNGSTTTLDQFRELYAEAK